MIEMRQYKHLNLITAIFVATLIISNTVATKFVNVGFLELTAGSLMFPVSYIFGDVLTEVYGYRVTKRVIWIGFACLLFMVIMYLMVQAFPAASFYKGQASYDAVLGMTPRIVLGSMLGYWCGEFSNSYVMARLKVWMKGKRLWVRTIGSTVVGELVDSFVMVFVAFCSPWNLAGLPVAVLVKLAVSAYIFKLAIEILFTPLTYWIIGALKRSEGVDHYDNDTNFNPFT